MDKFQKVGLSILGSALGIWGVLGLYKDTLNGTDWIRSIITVAIGGAFIAIAAILAKKGIDVGGSK